MRTNLEEYILIKQVANLFRSFSSAVAACDKRGGGPHHFAGYPRERGTCKYCGIPRMRT